MTHVDKLFSDLASHAGKPIEPKGTIMGHTEREEQGASVEMRQTDATELLVEYEKTLRQLAFLGAALEDCGISLEDLDLLNEQFGGRSFIDGHIENIKAQIAGMEE